MKHFCLRQVPMAELGETWRQCRARMNECEGRCGLSRQRFAFPCGGPVRLSSPCRNISLHLNPELRAYEESILKLQHFRHVMRTAKSRLPSDSGKRNGMRPAAAHACTN